MKQAFEDAMFCGIPLKLNYMALRGYNEQDYRWLVRPVCPVFPPSGCGFWS